MDAIVDNLPFMMHGLLVTLAMAGIAIALSLLLGTGLAAARLSSRRWAHYPAATYIELVRTVPLILFILYIYFILADAGINVSPFWSATLALAIFTSAYVAEVIRAGIQALPPGQMEAARASGLSYFQAMRHVILPQALRNMAPALVSELIKLTKDTSLAAVIGVFEFFNRVSLVNSRLITESFVLFGFAAIVYFVINYSLSLVAKRLELRADI
jgi:His/Glu/Gln/Arg/opine family amino acid ABC transporter permease subunit